MIAAIYARKSTEEKNTKAKSADAKNADADEKSVPRQIENARAFARTKGWTVIDAHVYADNAISGAETRRLVNRQRLLDALASPTPPFQILLMRDASRFSRRDGDEAFAELKRIAQAGVEIWFYQDAARFSFGTFSDNVVGFVRAEMNAEYRRQMAKWTHEAMVRKAKAGYVTGGRVFGYDNVRVDGHTERHQRGRGRCHTPHFRNVGRRHRLHAHRAHVERRARRSTQADARAPGRVEPLDDSRSLAPPALSRRSGLQPDAAARRERRVGVRGAPCLRLAAR